MKTDPILIAFNGDKEVGALRSPDGNHGLHIAHNPDAVIGERGDSKFGGEVPNEHTHALLVFTSKESIASVIGHLQGALKFFEEDEGIEHILDDYDYWVEPCKNCGFDGGRIAPPRKGNPRCWKCGRTVRRDFSDRALKPNLPKL